LGSLEETKQYTVLPSKGYKKMALLSPAESPRPCDTQEGANMMRTVGSGAAEFVERVKRLNSKIPLRPTSDEPGPACLFHCFAGFNDHVEPRPDTVTVFASTSLAG
jgi:hypothetical protein